MAAWSDLDPWALGAVAAAPFVGVALARATRAATAAPGEVLVALRRASGRADAPRLAAAALACAGIALVSAVVAEGAMIAVTAALGWWLLLIGWIDAETFWMPDALTLPLIPIGLAIVWLAGGRLPAEEALAAIAGFAGLAGLALAYRKVRGVDGLGDGDPRLLAAAGAWTGLQGLPFVLLVAACAGLIAALALRLSGRLPHWRAPIPFGPALAAAFWAGWLTR